MVNVHAKLIEQTLHHRELDMNDKGSRYFQCYNSSLLIIIIIKLLIFATISKKPFHMDGHIIIA